MKSASLLFAVALTLISAASADEIRDGLTGGEIEAGFKKCNLKHGISKKEARFLAEVYFMQHRGMCGALRTQVKNGKIWIFTTSEGASGKPGQPIEIDSTSGRIFCKGGVSYNPPWKEMTEWLDEFWESADVRDEKRDSAAETKKRTEGNAHQPTTALDTESEAVEKPKPESEACSQ